MPQSDHNRVVYKITNVNTGLKKKKKKQRKNLEAKVDRKKKNEFA